MVSGKLLPALVAAPPVYGAESMPIRSILRRPTPGHRRTRLACVYAVALALGLPACGDSPPATEQGGRPDAPSDERTPRKKADTPRKLIRCLKKQKVNSEEPSASTSGDIALSRGQKIEHETVVIGGNTDVVAYFLTDRSDVKRAKKALGLNDTVASSGSVVIAYLKAENRTSLGPEIEMCL